MAPISADPPILLKHHIGEPQIEQHRREEHYVERVRIKAEIANSAR